ncbi:cytochrome P450 [Frankia sp. AgB1.9]|uniref:cytochrome P450 n=1 Tax=unclassified Frankia TaxID=2632575 RepID=UPI001933D38D|nr:MULTISPECIES: cytochrome P450 [unclassified Frankia]MBL7491972.1 cytochrome P450 [Frankia sp. AgW1.1]MBL7548389.1 cytochrome P450 [Frankia sp. AgB1.9]MBL7619097.1 cytochrome P450 [Frankia sp. AgB1.8]
MTDLKWDPFDPVVDVDPYPVWRRMRDEQPLYRNDEYDFFAVSRHADVDDLHRDTKTYSSKYGTLLEIMGKDPIPPGFLIFSDPPVHNMLRTLVSRAYTPRRVGGLEGQVRELAAELLDRQIGGGGFDYVQDFAAQLPSLVISALIGVDPADREEVRRMIDLCFHIEEGAGTLNETALNASARLRAYFADQIQERRARPRDDMMTALVEAEVKDGDTTRRLTKAEAATLTNEMVSAGTETVARLLGWACLLLAAHPDQRAALVADPKLLASAVEETLRFEAPSPVQGRTVMADVELYGTKVPAGSRILLLTASAGRDERKYDDPDSYDIHRRFDSHVSFGHGVHFCLGASLARLEGRVALEETLRRFPTWDVDHDRAVRLHTSTVRGYEKLPILL